MELQNLQQQLKVAIQSHQILVSKMKADPQNASLQRQLHELQAEIMALSDKQKQVVQQLRKEIEIKHQTNSHHVQREVNHDHLSTTPLSLVKTSDLFTIKQVPVTVASTLVSKMTANEQNKPIYLTTSPKNNVTIDTSGVVAALNLTPAIRVPQYPPPCLRPTLVQPQVRLPSSSPSPTASARVRRASPVTTLKEEKTNNSLVITNSVHNKELFQKVDFMAALGLITHDTLSELQNRRSERKRRTTANPQFSYGNWELSGDKKRKSNNYLTSPLPLNFRKPRGRPRVGSTASNCPATPEDGSSNRQSPNGGTGPPIRNGSIDDSAEICSVCQNGGNLLHCDTCLLAFHRTCIDSSPSDSYSGSWICPKCRLMKKAPVHWPGQLAIVHSYIAHKAAKEEEKRRLLKRSLELKSELSQLEQKAKQLSETIAVQLRKRNELYQCAQQTQESIDFDFVPTLRSKQ
uniref:PHD-type domain-containing protein n=1 Tax=Strigamia maritima TaxID=126957 RepID=T1IXW0_STRMM